MPVNVLIGCQWGDEGKGKIADVMASNMDIVARYQGGNNAGHTVVIHGDKFVLHTLPSGILHGGVSCVIGNGVVLDPGAVIQEITQLEEQGFSVRNKLMISEQCHLILPQYPVLDRNRETALGKRRIGTTGKGIGAAYSEKMNRRGMRACDYRHPDKFAKKFRAYSEHVNELLKNVYDDEPLDTEKLLEEMLSYGDTIRPMLADTVTYLNTAIAEGKDVLAEGAQGVLLDVDFGTYPFVTSSNASPGGACTGLGISPRAINSITGVMKAYTTRVGSGPMPTELLDEDGETLRNIGGEFGSTTGRPRRCGWFDVPAARRALQVSNCSEIALTKLDVLSTMKEIKICTAYKLPKRTLDLLPFDTELLEDIEPHYEVMPGWNCDISSIRTRDAMPPELVNYVNTIEELIGTPITMIGVGPDRRQTILLEE